MAHFQQQQSARMIGHPRPAALGESPAPVVGQVEPERGRDKPLPGSLLGLEDRQVCQCDQVVSDRWALDR